MNNLETLRPEVAEAIRLFGAVIEELGLHDNYESALHVLCAELLRLQSTESRANEWQLRAEKAEAELAALKSQPSHGHAQDAINKFGAGGELSHEEMCEVVNQAVCAERELAALKVRIQWQPISTAPTDGTCILVSDADGDVRHAHWDKPGWWCGYDCYGNDAFVEDPTMWMPLPPPPKGEE